MQPWKIRRATTVYAFEPWLRLEEQQIELPDGRLIEPYFFIHLRPWAVMCVEDEAGRVLVHRHYRHGAGKVTLDLPGGIMDSGEAPIEAARREFLEETGCEAEDWTALGAFIPNSNYRCGEAHVFCARRAKQVAEPESGDLEETETLRLAWPELLHELATGGISSMSSATAILLARQHFTKP